MDLYTLFSAIRDGLAQDADLGAWAVIEFGSAIKVFSGIPADDFPNMDADAPFIALGDPADLRGAGNRTIVYELSGWIGLTNADRTVQALDNVTEPAGVKQVIDGLRLVRDAVIASLPEGITLERFETAADTLGAHDEVNGHFDMTLSQELLIGQSPFG